MTGNVEKPTLASILDRYGQKATCAYGELRRLMLKGSLREEDFREIQKQYGLSQNQMEEVFYVANDMAIRTIHARNLNAQKNNAPDDKGPKIDDRGNPYNYRGPDTGGLSYDLPIGEEVPVVHQGSTKLLFRLQRGSNLSDDAQFGPMQLDER